MRSNANAAYLDRNGQIQRRFASAYGATPINVRLTNGSSIHNAMVRNWKVVRPRMRRLLNSDRSKWLKPSQRSQINRAGRARSRPRC
jgi:hypothetical protein